jgi:hypothetical protein
MSQNPEFLDLVPLIPAGNDVDETAEYYMRELGFQLLWRDGAPTEMAALKRGSVEVLLYRNDDESVAQQTSIRILVGRVDLLYEEFRTKGVKLHERGALRVSAWGTREFAVIDPSGVCITFYEPEK